MAKRKQKKLSKARIIVLLKRYKRIKVVFRDSDADEVGPERVLTIRGSCVVRWPRIDGKYSRYSVSCFAFDIREYEGFKKDRAKQIVEKMVNYLLTPWEQRKLNRHIVEVRAGRGFKRKVG